MPCVLRMPRHSTARALNRAGCSQAIKCRAGSNAPTAKLSDAAEGVVGTSLSSSSLARLKVAELKDELGKRGIAPGRKRKAELVQALAEVLSNEEAEVTYEVVPGDSPACHQDSGSNSAEASNRTSSQFLGRPRKIKFVDIKGLEDEAQIQLIQSSIHAVPFWWLGTCGATPTGTAHSASFALRASNEMWLFDCGDDTQRQLHKVCTGRAATSIKHLKIARLFFTSLSGSRLYGLPGMICTLSAAKGDSRQEETPMHVYGPEGLASFLAMMLSTSDTFVIVPVLVFEFVPRPVSEAEARPACLNDRAKLYRVRVPADAYNPAGYTDAKMSNPRLVPDTHGRRSGQRGGGRDAARGSRVDLRQNVRAAHVPPPGDPSAPPQPMHELRWTLVCDSEFQVTVTGVEEPQTTLSYTIDEPVRSGRLIVAACEALDVQPGRAYTDLKAGLAVTNAAGATVLPEQVVTPDQPGRRIHIAGQYTSHDALRRTVQHSDMLLCEVATGDEEGARAAGLLTPPCAAALAATIGCECIVPWARCSLHNGRLRACSRSETAELDRRLNEVAPEGVAVMMPQALQLSVIGKPT